MKNDTHTNLNAKHSNYIAPLAMFFYMLLLSSSIAGQKLITIFNFVISAGTIIFPITYMTIACITEIYGFTNTKKIIFMGAACNLFVSLYLYFVVKIPHDKLWMNQEAFSKITTTTVIILLTSTIAYIVSEYTNAKVISKLKILLKGKWLIGRAITSTSSAVIIDSFLMLPVIFYNSPHEIWPVFFSLIIIKIIYEILLLPFLWLLVEFLKTREGIYYNELQTPFSSISYVLKDKTSSDN